MNAWSLLPTIHHAPFYIVRTRMDRMVIGGNPVPARQQRPAGHPHGQRGGGSQRMKEHCKAQNGRLVAGAQASIRHLAPQRCGNPVILLPTRSLQAQREEVPE